MIKTSRNNTRYAKLSGFSYIYKLCLQICEIDTIVDICT